MLVPLVRRFRARHHYYPNLIRPRTFSEKILCRMLFDRRSFVPVFAGKLESRGFVAQRLGGDEALIPLIGVVRHAPEIRRIELPKRFVMKASHGSGMIYIHADDAPPDLGHLEKLCREWISHDTAKYSGEWCYKNVERVVIVEELITDVAGNIPADYKFFCFDGIPRFIQVDSARFSGHTRDIFDCGWNRIPGRLLHPNSDQPPEPPEQLKNMFEIAAALSEGVDFIRVDLYDVGQSVKFGELTNTPGMGLEIFDPPELDRVFGEHWRLSFRDVPVRRLPA